MYFYSLDGRLVGETGVDGNTILKYVYGSSRTSPDYIIEEKFGVRKNNYKILKDHLGSPRIIINADSGELIRKVEHDEFGKVLVDSNGEFSSLGFAGGLYDVETKLVRFGARDYDPELGRWLSKDPIRFNGGDSNLYGYVIQDPVNGIDPVGLAVFYLGGGYSAGLFGTVRGGELGSYIGNPSGNDSSTGAYNSKSSGNVYGGVFGFGFSTGFYTGNTSGFSGTSSNYNLLLGPVSLSFSYNNGGWGAGFGFGGKGFGLGVSVTESCTTLDGSSLTKGAGR